MSLSEDTVIEILGVSWEYTSPDVTRRMGHFVYSGNHPQTFASFSYFNVGESLYPLVMTNSLLLNMAIEIEWNFP